jgi:hypothetical protein
VDEEQPPDRATRRDHRDDQPGHRVSDQTSSQRLFCPERPEWSFR